MTAVRLGLLVTVVVAGLYAMDLPRLHALQPEPLRLELAAMATVSGCAGIAAGLLAAAVRKAIRP